MLIIRYLFNCVLFYLLKNKNQHFLDSLEHCLLKDEDLFYLNHVNLEQYLESFTAGVKGIKRVIDPQTRDVY